MLNQDRRREKMLGMGKRGPIIDKFLELKD
jgi:hypothetical protein